MKNLSINEKLQLLIGDGLWATHDANGKVYKVKVTDGPMGVRQPKDGNPNEKDMPSVTYPSAQLLSCTWDPTLARATGNAIANDCIDRDLDVLLAPGVNVKRLPICGRNFEYISEDPFLAGTFAYNYIVGVQEKNIGTSLKHYCANNVEYARNWISSDVDERTLREIYLTAFEMACKAKPWTVMCAYNLLNGTRMSENANLYNVLRNEFGFDGAIISDWGAVTDRIASLNAGLDLEMPGNDEHVRQLNDALQQGLLDIDKVDQSAERMVHLANKCQAAKAVRKADMTVLEREHASLRVAEEGIVLLKNSNNLLPLSTNANILVTGAPLNFYYFGGGSSQVPLRNKYVNIQQALGEYCPNVKYVETVMCDRGHCSDMGNLPAAIEAAKGVDVSIVCVGNNDACESESFDRQHISLSRESRDAIKAIAAVSKKTVVVVYAGSVVDMAEWEPLVDAIVWAGYGGEFVNVALAKILVGLVNPSGKTTETFPLALADVPAMNSPRNYTNVTYSEGLNVGYRYFNTANVPVLFPFGWGLSYSKFDYENLQIEGSGTNFTVTFEVKNTSDVGGKEVAQLYVRPVNPTVYRPNKELKGFCKLFVDGGGKAQATLTLDMRSFAHYDVQSHGWVVDEGDYEIQICSNVQQVELKQTIKVK